MQYLYKGSGHQKLWHMFEIAYQALGLELLTPYVKCCKDWKITPSDISDPNYGYMQQVLTHLRALMTFRSG